MRSALLASLFTSVCMLASQACDLKWICSICTTKNIMLVSEEIRLSPLLFLKTTKTLKVHFLLASFLTPMWINPCFSHCCIQSVSVGMVLVVCACSTVHFRINSGPYNFIYSSQSTAFCDQVRDTHLFCFIRSTDGSHLKWLTTRNGAQITAQQSKTEAPQDFLWSPPSINFRGSPNGFSLGPRGCQRCIPNTATKQTDVQKQGVAFGCQKHLNMIAWASQGMLMPSPSLITIRRQAVNADADHLLGLVD